MWSQRTSDLYKLFDKSRKEDFNQWLPKTVEEEVGKYLADHIKVKCIYFDRSNEFDDQGGYHDYISGVSFYGEDNNHISLDDEENFKPEYKGDGFENLPIFDDLYYEIFNDITDEIRDWDLWETNIDIEAGV